MYINTNYSSYNILNTLGLSAYSNTSKATGALGTSLMNSLTSRASRANSYLSQETLSYAKNLKSESNALSSAMRELTSGTAFNKRNAVSDNTDALKITSAPISRYANMAEMQVDIEQIATAQRNEGAALSSTASAGMNSRQTFELEVGGKSHRLSIDVRATDTNRNVQDKMATAINSLNAGVIATVTTKNNTSTLSVTSSKTGQGNEFTLTDIIGGAVQKTGANTNAQEAQDAMYRINGGDIRTSKSNDIELSGGVKATLKSTTDKAVNITAGTDRQYTLDKARQMVESYNSLLSAAQKNAGNTGASSLYSKLSSNSRAYAASLSRVGISVDKEGYMSINEDRLKEAANSNGLQNLMQGNGNYGFANQVSRIANDVSLNPQRYVSTSSPASGNDIYGLYSSMLSQRNTQLYNNMGLLFDYMI